MRAPGHLQATPEDWAWRESQPFRPLSFHLLFLKGGEVAHHEEERLDFRVRTPALPFTSFYLRLQFSVWKRRAVIPASGLESTTYLFCLRAKWKCGALVSLPIPLANGWTPKELFSSVLERRWYLDQGWAKDLQPVVPVASYPLPGLRCPGSTHMSMILPYRHIRVPSRDRGQWGNTASPCCCNLAATPGEGWLISYVWGWKGGADLPTAPGRGALGAENLSREMWRWWDIGQHVSPGIQCPALTSMFYPISPTNCKFKDRIIKNFKALTAEH